MPKHDHIDPVHLEAYINADSSAGISFLVYRAGVDITAQITGSVGIAITDIDIVTQNAASILLAANSNAAGRIIAGGNVAANSGIVRELRTPHYCPLGVVPKIFGAAAGELRAVLHGFLYKG